MKITVNSKDVEVEKALPLQLGDLRRLKREFDFILGVDNNNVEKQFGFYLVILQKANPDITPEDVDALTIAQMTAISTAVTDASKAADVPFSASSTS